MKLHVVPNAILCLVLAAVTQSALGQTFSVIHNFNGQDGSSPEGRLAMDKAGSLYGTSYVGGPGYGTVFKLSPHGSGWIFATLYNFTGGGDGANPSNGVVFGPDGSFYGTTSYTVFNLKPSPTRPPTVFSPWRLTTLYEFQGILDGFEPYGDLVFDQAGNIYGATLLGGQGCYEGCGIVYELTPSNGSWTKTVLYYFTGANDGLGPTGVMFDQAGDLYGTAFNGGTYGAGTIFKLTPSGSGWMGSALYSFDPDGNSGYFPEAELISDAAGNYYGSTSNGPGNSGTIFELSPSNGAWTYTVLYQLPSKYDGGPAAPLTMDAAGNLYGTINGACGGGGCSGAVFKLTPGSGGWTFASLHDFTNGSDGGHPLSNVVIDANGNLYGTASEGGTGCSGNGCGVVWKITP